MSRPKTEAAEYVRFSLRLPPDVVAWLKERSGVTGAPINTEVVRALRRDREALQPAKRRSVPA